MAKYSLLLLFLTLLLSCEPKVEKTKWAIAIHGGAGNITRDLIDEKLVQEYNHALQEVLETGSSMLQEGEKAVNVVEKVVTILEDNPLFNAGKGAVFTHDGRNELDAAIMDGRDLNAGTIAGVGDIKNPIRAARAVMEQSPHVMMVGKGASKFAAENGIEIVDSSYFYTGKRWKSLQLVLQKSEKNGTVGCVVMDEEGNLAAATSTGGMTNKRYGRVGDVPIIGAGTYANNKTCAVSATGHGEYFIRYTVAHDISALMEYKGLSLAKAANLVVNGKLNSKAGNGGVIAVDKKGNLVLEMNSSGMFRAWANSKGKKGVAIFKD